MIGALAPIERRRRLGGRARGGRWIADRLTRRRRARPGRGGAVPRRFRGRDRGPLRRRGGRRRARDDAARPQARRPRRRRSPRGLIADDISNGARPFRKLVRPGADDLERGRRGRRPGGRADARRPRPPRRRPDRLHLRPALPGGLIDQLPGRRRAHRHLAAALVAGAAGPLLAAAGGLSGRKGLAARRAALISAGAAATMADIQRSPTVPGANDNLTAVAVIVALAEALRERSGRGPAGPARLGRRRGGAAGRHLRLLRAPPRRPRPRAHLLPQRRDRRRPVAGPARGRGMRRHGGLLRPAVSRPDRPRRRARGDPAAARDARRGPAPTA